MADYLFQKIKPLLDALILPFVDVTLCPAVPLTPQYRYYITPLGIWPGESEENLPKAHHSDRTDCR